MPLTKTSVEANEKNTRSLLDNLRREYTRMLVDAIPQFTDKDHKDVLQTAVDIAFSSQNEDERKATDYIDSADGYIVFIMHKEFLDNEDIQHNITDFEYDMNEKYIEMFILGELADCGIKGLQDEETEFVVRASMDITQSFINVISAYHYKETLDYNSFKKRVDEVLTEAYESISADR